MRRYEDENGIPTYIIQNGEKVKPQDIPEPFAVVIAKSKRYMKRTNFLYSGFFEIQEDTTLGEVDETITLFMELKIPHALFMSIESFFREIYEKKKSEVAVLLFFNRTLNKWAYCIPQQTVAAASVHYDMKKGLSFVKEEDMAKYLSAVEEGYVMVGSIHSHAALSAFHSGVDDKDEFGFDGIHVTIGNFQNEGCTYACRLMLGQKEFKKELKQVVDFPPKPVFLFPEKSVELVSDEVKVLSIGAGTAYPVSAQGSFNRTYSSGAGNAWNQNDLFGTGTYAYGDGVVMGHDE